jgi:CRISPR-associated protein Cas2
VRQGYVVAYDISDPRRLRRTYRAMLGFGDPLQLSVFRCDLSEVEKVKLKARLSEIINHAEDRVLIVGLGPADGRGRTAFEYLGAQEEVRVEREAVIV